METQTEIMTQVDNVEENAVDSKCIISFDKKRIIMAIKWILILSLVLSYFIYQQLRYLDTTINRREFVNKISVNEMPKPFIFLSYEENYQCQLKVINTSAQLSGTDLIQLLLEPTVTYTVADFGDISLEHILSNVTQHQHILITNSVQETLNWTEFLWIPSNDAAQYTGVGTLLDSLIFVLLCPTTSSSGTTTSNMVNDFNNLGGAGVSSGGIVYYKLDHKETLYKYNDLMDIFGHQLEYTHPIAPGGVGIVSYEWFVVDNKITKNESNKYRQVSVEFYEIGDNLLMFGLSSIFTFIPTASGDKTITTITKLFSVWDVIAGTGGIFSAVSSFLGIVFMYLIWGVGKFNGVASKSFPSSIEKRKMKPFIDKCIDDRNDPYEKQINALKTEIENLKQLIQENRST
eukprot:12065_1